uniref:Uncharacterized protein n=1 Tax=Knipowitschia caucasica TaxID=637954 RepID=A0AAV2KFL1_KNICA
MAARLPFKAPNLDAELDPGCDLAPGRTQSQLPLLPGVAELSSPSPRRDDRARSGASQWPDRAQLLDPPPDSSGRYLTLTAFGFPAGLRLGLGSV